MIQFKETQEAYFSSFASLEKRLGRIEPSWLRQIRRAAIDRFAELGFPTTRLEAWRFTNVAPIANTRFEVAPHALKESSAAKLKRVRFADLDCSRLVFINGAYSPELSSPDVLPEGVKVGSLGQTLAGGAPVLEQHLARYARYQDHPFVALNTAFLEDGAFVEVPKGVVLEKPVHLLFVSTVNGLPTVSHPRSLIILGRESQASFIEMHVGLEDNVYFTNAVTEVVVGENATVDYCKVQHESEPAFHMATLEVYQGRSSNVATHSISFGGALARQEVNAVLDGEGSECYLNGLYLVRGRQHVDNYTTIDHAKAHATSRELYKGILDDRSSGVFHGRILVRKDAQKTDAKQSNKNLLLSDDATINTKPQLEIYADDVRCTHGATVGQIDPEALFYLRSRCIAHEEARRMLTLAFANEVIKPLKFEPLRARLAEALVARLSSGQGAREG